MEAKRHTTMGTHIHGFYTDQPTQSGHSDHVQRRWVDLVDRMTPSDGGRCDDVPLFLPGIALGNEKTDYWTL